MQNTHPALLVTTLKGIQSDLFSVLKDGRHVSQSDLSKLLVDAPSQSTISRALKVMIASGLVEKSGSTKAALFYATPLAKYWSTPAHLRTPVKFDPERINNYVPNTTSWLPRQSKAAMEHACSGWTNRLDASTYSKQIAERFLIDLAWSSSALEGNTYSMLDTEVLIKYGQAAEGHDAIETTMILNHKRAISLLLEQVEKTDIPQTLSSHVHGHLMRGLLSPEALGTVRNSEVRISHSSYRPCSSRPELSSALGSLLWKAEQITEPFEAMFFLMVGISYIQAFEDGNKRLGRLMSNIPLLRAGLPPMSFIGINKKNYIQGLIDFYELGNTDLLGATLAQSYVESSPSYQSATESKRIPRSIEIRHRILLDQIILDCVEKRISGDPISAHESSVLLTAKLTSEDQVSIGDIASEILQSLSVENSHVWGVSAEKVALFKNFETVSPKRSHKP